MSNDRLNDPFDDDNGLEDFDLLDQQQLDDGGDQGLGGEFDEEAPDDLSPAAPAQQASKPTAVAAGEPKAFLKTPLGMGVIAGCVAMLGVVGYGAVGVLTSSSPEPEVVQQAVIPEASEPAVFGSKTGVNAPEAQLPAAPQFAKPATPVNDALAMAQAQSQAQQQNPNPILQALPANQAVTPQIQAPQLDKVAQPAADREVQELRSTISELTAQTKIVTSLVKDVNSAVDRLNRQQIELTAEVKGIRAEIAKAKAAEAQVQESAPKAASSEPQEAKTVSTSSKAAAPAKPASIVDGRTRLAGLQVIDTSQNGEMSIIKKASNGRIFTLYPNETLNWGGRSHKVSTIEKEGSVVLVGDKFFIDKVLEAQKPEPKPVREAQSRPAPKAAAVDQQVDAKGFTLNAVYDSNRSFGVVNNKGEFKSYKIGDKIDNLGVVTGLTPSGDLKVGNTIIKSVY